MMQSLKMIFKPSYQALGDTILLMEWPAEINRTILLEILGYQNSIATNPIKGVIETYPTYYSLAVVFNPDEINFNQLKTRLEQLSLPEFDPPCYRWSIPVCYAGEQAPDMPAFAKAKRMTSEEIISLHTSATYTVFFMGFLPGFLYLGGLNQKLHHPRKPVPERVIPRGSVAIGGSQTGIYPAASPGGWHVIGNSPVTMFDHRMNPPCFAQPGDEIIFEAICPDTWQLLSLEISADTYVLKKEKING